MSYLFGIHAKEFHHFPFGESFIQNLSHIPPKVVAVQALIAC